MKNPRILLSGIGGYARIYISAMLHPDKDALPFEFVAAADPFAERCADYQALTDAGVRVYHDISEFFADGGECDICIIASPIQFHLEQVRLAMAHGAHVMCEKPIGACAEQALAMLALEQQYDRRIMIGFQWSYDQGMLALKRDILAGRYGRPLDLRVMVDWPRGSVYYARPWAGKRLDSEGRMVNDSIANNACAHYIHNMLFLLGDAMDESAAPACIDAQLYRANAIDNYDTAFVSLKAAGAQLLFAASHAGGKNGNPVLSYRFEKAVITMDADAQGAYTLRARTADGDVLYRMESTHQCKFYAMLRILAGMEEHVCTVRTALPHMQCIEALSAMPVNTIAPALTDRLELHPGDFYNVAQGMDELLARAFDTGMLPAAGDAEFVAASCHAEVAAAI